MSLEVAQPSDYRPSFALSAPTPLMGKPQCLLMGGHLLQGKGAALGMRGERERVKPPDPSLRATPSEFRNGSGDLMAPGGWWWLLLLLLRVQNSPRF